MRIGRGATITLLLVVLTLIGVGAVGLVHWRPGLAHGLPVVQIALTTAAVLMFWIISRIIDKAADGFHEGRFGWQRKLRDMMHAEPEERFREVDLFAGLLHLIFWLWLPIVLLQIWGLSDIGFDMVKQFAWTGFPVGQMKIVPAQLLLGAVLLVIFTAVIRWLTHRLETRWLARTPMESHTREAIATLTGYVLFVIAAMVVLSYAGLDLSKLALIAGALSVGIGFGLQNIVSNFVSGLILLFEQPIRRGNFITVGESEGFVRRIRIRATEIETLNRVTVIVPNSEMLSSHVQNWNLRDRFGRISCKVGVAYGSNVRLVQKLLLEVAAGHRDVLNDLKTGVPKPQALFISFGGSTLDFELRCFVRDITRRFPIMSDLNLAIDDAFREHDITLAFPQLDVWHRSMPPAGDTATSDLSQADEPDTVVVPRPVPDQPD